MKPVLDTNLLDRYIDAYLNDIEIPVRKCLDEKRLEEITSFEELCNSGYDAELDSAIIYNLQARAKELNTKEIDEHLHNMLQNLRFEPEKYVKRQKILLIGADE